MNKEAKKQYTDTLRQRYFKGTKEGDKSTFGR